MLATSPDMLSEGQVQLQAAGSLMGLDPDTFYRLFPFRESGRNQLAAAEFRSTSNRSTAVYLISIP